jgi:ChrR Cupin-like domain
VHIGGEEFLVLKGTFKDQFGAFGAGTYVRNPIGSQHAPWVDDDGCTIFVKLLQMADTDESVAPLHVDLSTAKKDRGRTTPFGVVVDLYSNGKTGEAVEMCWLHAGATLLDDNERGLLGGEELFVVDGSLYWNKVEYERWGWLRFPVAESSSRRSDIVAGSAGAQVFRKTGHLTAHALSMEKIQIHDD